MSKWYTDGLYFSCTRCGACCTGAPGYVWLKKGEVDKIAEYLNIGRDEFLSTYTVHVYGKCSLKEKSSGDCIFLKRDPAGCEIYEVRPVQCRVWPFWKEILQKREYWNTTAESCPGMNSGCFHSAEEIEEKLRLHEKE